MWQNILMWVSAASHKRLMLSVWGKWKRRWVINGWKNHRGGVGKGLCVCCSMKNTRWHWEYSEVRWFHQAEDPACAAEITFSFKVWVLSGAVSGGDTRRFTMPNRFFALVMTEHLGGCLAVVCWLMWTPFWCRESTSWEWHAYCWQGTVRPLVYALFSNEADVLWHTRTSTARLRVLIIFKAILSQID